MERAVRQTLFQVMWVELQQKSEASVTVKEAIKAKLCPCLLTFGSVFLRIFESFCQARLSMLGPKILNCSVGVVALAVKLLLLLLLLLRHQVHPLRC
jgi:hypothetical protein